MVNNGRFFTWRLGLIFSLLFIPAIVFGVYTKTPFLIILPTVFLFILGGFSFIVSLSAEEKALQELSKDIEDLNQRLKVLKDK